MSAGWLLNTFRSSYNHITGYNVSPCLFVQVREYAARKGTREKAKKKKVKVAVEKIGFIAHNMRVKKHDKSKIQPKISPMIKIDDSKRVPAIDNVWIIKYHKRPVYSFKEAIEFHRETHHPTMYNLPNGTVNAHFDLDLQREKKTKFLEKFTKLIQTPHPFDNHEEREILAFCKSADEQKAAKDAGVAFVGGIELIKQIQNGSFPFKEYNHIIAHTDIIADLLLIRGLLKKKFPNIRSGNLGTDMGRLVKKFKHGIEYTSSPIEGFKNFGEINVPIGTLDMEIQHLEENFSALIKDVESQRPRRTGDFILRVLIDSPPSPERFRIDLEPYLSSTSDKKPEEEEDEVDDNTEAVIAMH